MRHGDIAVSYLETPLIITLDLIYLLCYHMNVLLKPRDTAERMNDTRKWGFMFGPTFLIVRP